MLIITLISLFPGCSRKQAVFLYDDYYPVVFDYNEKWQTAMQKTASRHGVNLLFRNIESSGGIPALGPVLAEHDQQLIITSPLLSGRLADLFASSADTTDYIFVDLDFRSKSLSDNHICIKYDRSAAYTEAGGICAEFSASLNAKVIAIFSSQPRLSNSYKDAFIKSFSRNSGTNPEIIEINPDEPEARTLQPYYNQSETILFYVCAGRQTAKIIKSIPENHYSAGEFAASLKPFKENLLFSIEYFPLDHFSALLDHAFETQNSGSAEFFRVVRYSR